MKNYKQFVNESYDNLQNIYDRLISLNDSYIKEQKKLKDLENKELSDVIHKLIRSNNIELINKVIESKPKDLYISSFQFLHGAIYKLKTKMKDAKVEDVDISFTDLEESFEKLKLQNEVLNSIIDESNELIRELTENYDTDDLRNFVGKIDNLPGAQKFYKKLNVSYVMESYQISQDDYNYFKGLIEDESDLSKEELADKIKNNRSDWEKTLLLTAKHHWGIGGGERDKFPATELKKVIDDVLDDYTDQKTEQRKSLTFKSKNNELFHITFKFDDKGRLDKVSNKWDVKFPDWWGLNVSDAEIIDYFRRKYPEYYVDKTINENSNINESTIPFEDEITIELKKLYKGTIVDKTDSIDKRVDQLLSLHSKWLEIAKKHYNAEEIAKKLFKYDKDLGNTK